MKLKDFTGLSFTYFFSILFWIAYYFIDASNGFKYNDNLFVIDWHRELQYLGIIKYSLINLEFPFHIPNLTDFGFSERFLGTPVYSLFIHSLGLLFLSEFNFHLLNHLFFYSLGFWGCLLFRQKFSLSFISFFFLVITLNFYGGFVTKITAYGPSQLGYYMIPFIIFCLIEFSENKNNNIKSNLLNAIFLSISLSLVLLNGSTHFFVLFITFVTFWFIFNFKKLKILFLIGGLTFLLTAYKVLPASMVFGVDGNTRVVHGYTLNPEFFLQTFISIRGVLDTGLFMSKNNIFAYQEYSNYISIIGLIVILFFGLIHYLILDYSKVKIKSFILPLCVLFVCAFENFRLFIIPDFLPLFNAESRTMGYVSVIVLFLLFTSSINLDDWYKKNLSFKIKLFSNFLLVIHTFYLFLNLFIWRIQNVQYSFVYDPKAEKEFYDNKIINSVKLSINNDYSDSIYIYSFYFGLLLTTLTFILIILYLIKLKFRKSF